MVEVDILSIVAIVLSCLTLAVVVIKDVRGRQQFKFGHQDSTGTCSSTKSTRSSVSGGYFSAQHFQCGRPKRFILIRHGESQANVDRTLTQHVPDHSLHLTEKGQQQAIEAGERLKKILGRESARFIVSPYTRTRETLNGIALAFGGIDDIAWQEEPRLREQEFGNYDAPNMDELQAEKRTFGSFFYRFPEGESQADVYDRASSFLETLYRMWEQVEEDNYVIVCHGTMMLVFMMRFMQLSTDEFYNLSSLKNCEFIVMELTADNTYENIHTIVPGGTAHEGMRQNDSDTSGKRKAMWDPQKMGHTRSADTGCFPDALFCPPNAPLDT